MLLKLIRNCLQRKKSTAELNELALEHHTRGELDKAEQYFRDVALQIPSELSAWTNLAATVIKQQKYTEAIPLLLQIIELQPKLAEAYLDLGVCYNRLKNNAEAIRHYRTAISLKPALAAAHANVINAYLDCCDWDAVDRWTREFLEFKKGRAVQEWAERLEPFCAFSMFPGAISRDVSIHRSRQIERSIGTPSGGRPSTSSRRPRSRIRVGYVSADFYSHATAHLTFGLYETHNRPEFEIFGYSMGPDDRSVYRRHIEQTCDQFIDVRSETAESTAQRIRNDEIDILIDMKVHTTSSRPQIFAHRAAPVQVNYLGYPGTSGARFIDYFISDHVATPPGHENEFTERIVYMPECYQVNDHRQPISPLPVSRAGSGLPEHAFVYCSFNTLRKIDRTIFSVWMDILRNVPNSVLWLIREDPQAEINLRREAHHRNVGPDRLIFAEKTDKPTHLARHRLADLFLDTYVCNAHTTASDSLWAGLPLLTCPGATFARRVAASLLTAAELPELIARDLGEYESIAIQLAQDRGLLATFRSRLEQNRTSCSLFDTPRYVKNLEAAYRRMLDIYRSGLPPQSFSVASH